MKQKHRLAYKIIVQNGISAGGKQAESSRGDQLEGRGGPGSTFYRVDRRGLPEDAKFKRIRQFWRDGRGEGQEMAEWRRCVLSKGRGKYETLGQRRIELELKESQCSWNTVPGRERPEMFTERHGSSLLKADFILSGSH